MGWVIIYLKLEQRQHWWQMPQWREFGRPSYWIDDCRILETVELDRMACWWVWLFFQRQKIWIYIYTSQIILNSRAHLKSLLMRPISKHQIWFWLTAYCDGEWISADTFGDVVSSQSISYVWSEAVPVIDCPHVGTDDYSRILAQLVQWEFRARFLSGYGQSRTAINPVVGEFSEVVFFSVRMFCFITGILNQKLCSLSSSN